MNASKSPTAARSVESPVDFDALPPIPDRGSSLAAEWWIARRHLGGKKQEFFVSIVTVLSVIGVMLGVGVVNSVVAVMTGFEVDLRDKILGANAHVVVLRYGGSLVDYESVTESVEQVDGVKAAAPFIYTEMMVRSQWATRGIILKGMDPWRTGKVTSLEHDLDLAYAGELTTHEQRVEALAAMADTFPALDVGGQPVSLELEKALPGIIIGNELQEQLQVSVGDKVQLINPMGGGTGPMGMPTPTVRSFRVAGVYHSGMYEYDNKWTYINNLEAQSFLKMGETVTGIEIKVDDIDGVEDIALAIDEKLGYPHYTRHWKNLNQALFEALELEKQVMGALFMMIVVIAGFLIITTLIMMVLTKGREIAILKAIGAPSRSILRIFVIEGSVIGLFGTISGTLLGLAICKGLATWEFPLATDVYFVSSLPVVIDPVNFGVIGVSAFVICFVCTLYPAWKAASLDPVEGLRYE